MAFAYEAKITVGEALKTSWLEALDTETKQLLDTGTLRALNFSNVPFNASVIHLTMVLCKKPYKYKAILCSCGNELKGQEECHFFTAASSQVPSRYYIFLLSCLHKRILLMCRITCLSTSAAINLRK